MIEGGIDMETSTGDMTQGFERNNERLGSGTQKSAGTAENNPNEGGETTASALQNGKLNSKIISCNFLFNFI